MSNGKKTSDKGKNPSSWRNFPDIPSLDVLRADIKRALPRLEEQGVTMSGLSRKVFNCPSRLRRFQGGVIKNLSVPSIQLLIKEIDQLLDPEPQQADSDEADNTSE
ncbi:hypothetical protein [Ruegeria lacuscaerulensis]|uniref:hypothetical protein n=1 Tax=Ruegeria lacuscaerulensis TaxID=55218 RepID=UPI00147A9612|nr:hypothetical protein [Ruegeria lacuscaerulensis]